MDNEDALLEQRVLHLADAIREQLSEKVNKPGEIAIKAVLAMRDDTSLKQKEAMKRFRTSKDSIRKYAGLLLKLTDTTPPVVEAEPRAISSMEVVPLPPMKTIFGRPLDGPC